MKTKEEKINSSLFYVKIMNMTKIQKYLICILTILVCISSTFCFSIYRSIYVIPNQIDTTYISIKNDKIPESMKNHSIAYFSDFQYGNFQNINRSKTFFKQLKHLSPDIVIFGGDLFDQSYTPNEEDIEFIKNAFKSIEAPLGKFAIFGEQDVFSSERKQLVESIYKHGEIEVLYNNRRSISNQSMDCIQIIGIGPNPSWSQALSSVQEKDFNLLLCHKPDFLLSHDLNHMPIDYALAGHSHGEQISLPFMGGYQEITGAKKINMNEGKKLDFPYHVTSGVGCTQINARFRSKPEIVYLLLK